MKIIDKPLRKVTENKKFCSFEHKFIYICLLSLQTVTDGFYIRYSCNLLLFALNEMMREVVFLALTK